MGGFSKANEQAGQYKFQSAQARARGVQQKAEAYQQAYSLESTAKQNSYLAMGNMAAMRENQASAVGAALTQAGGSGFLADTGTQRANQIAVQNAFETQIANMNKSNVISDENARGQANATRAYGDRAQEMANIEAEYYNKLASSASKMRWWYLVGDTLQLFGSAGTSFGGGGGEKDTGLNGSAGASSSSGGSSYVSSEGFTGRTRT